MLALVVLVTAAAGSVGRDHISDWGRRLIEAVQPHRLGLPWMKADIDWQTATPESQGMDSSELARLMEDLAIRDTDAFLVIRNNRVVYEWYTGDLEGPNEQYYTASLAKALVGSTALMVAATDGRIDIDDPVTEYVPTWEDDPGKAEITIRQLATHSSGLEDASQNGRPHGEENGWKGEYWLNRSEEFEVALHEAPLVEAPGTELRYSNPGFSVLAYAITASLHGSSTPDIYTLLKERIMEPIGVPAQAWEISYGDFYRLDGLKLYSIRGGGTYTARAAARVGALMLRKGKWQGRQLISRTIIEEATGNAGPRKMTRPPNYPAPGLGWWSNADGTWDALPRDAYAGVGIDHQVLLVVPSLELIVVRFGGALGNPSPHALGSAFWQNLEEHLFEPLMACFLESDSAAVSNQ
jgi:CubicO group peptidase (beta-lactamase class C family)